jgi:hypothetical protein
MSDNKKRDRALQRRVRARQDKTGEGYQAAWRRLTGDKTGDDTSSPLDHRRIPLPFTAEVQILPGQSAQITARPQVASFWPDRLLIKDAGSWAIHQLTVENKAGSKHSLIETADQSAAAFSPAIWQPLPAREVICGDAVVLVVTYRGSNLQGARFEAALFGWEGRLPAKATNSPSSGQSAKRISEHATSPEVRSGQIVKLPWTIKSPALFVDRVTITNAKHWIVNDIRTRGISIFLQSGDVPAEMFSDATDVILEPLKEGDLVLVLATYIGRESFARFTVKLSGTAVPPRVARALSYFLPASTGVTVLPTQSALLTARPQTAAPFLPERLVIADSASWAVNDIKIGNASQFAQWGDVPALSFDGRTVGSHVMFCPVLPAQDFIIVTTRSSSCDESAPFFCGVQGRLVEENESPRGGRARSASTNGDRDKDRDKDVSSYKPQLVLPLTPNAENAHRVGHHIPRILPNLKTRIVVRPIHGAFTIENLFISRSADWIVNEIEIEGRPQRVPKDIPGTLFGSGSHARVSFAGLDVVERDRELALIVTYVGTNPEGIPFHATATGSRPAQNPTVVPITARDPLQPASSMTIRVSAPSTAFRVERFIIEDGNTGGGSADWIVNDVRIANQSQFVQSGDIPGDLFATNAIDNFMKFGSWPVDAMIEIDVTYIGLREEGALFRARLEGAVVRDDYDIAPPDLSVFVETTGQGTVVIATCNFRPLATSSSMP